MTKKKPKKERKPPKEVVQLMEKVKKQLASFQKPVSDKKVLWPESKVWEEPWRFRRSYPVTELTIEEYRKLDPFWLTTMGGQFAGRVAKFRSQWWREETMCWHKWSKWTETKSGGGERGRAMSEPCEIVKELDDKGAVIGFGTKRLTDEHCPECGTLLDSDCSGYGLAYGGGCGFYQFCAKDECNWFWKDLDRGDA
jgi:hypothetical protein